MRGIDLNRIEDFLKIVELGNITRAAEALGERKAKLSRNLALLERDLGVQLVYRTTRQFQLTGPGLDFYHQMKVHYAGLEDVITSLVNREEEIEGGIRLTAPEDIGNQIVTPIVHDFCNRYPKTRFELIYTNQMLDLVKLGIDIAFRIGNLKDSALIHRKVGQVDLIAAASPAYLEKAKALASPDDLTKHSTIGFSAADKFVWRLFSQSSKRAVQVKPDFIANNYLTIRDLTLLGRGVSFLPRFLVEGHIRRGELVHVLRHWRNEGSPVQLTMPSQKNIAKRIRKFFDFAAKAVAEAL